MLFANQAKELGRNRTIDDSMSKTDAENKLMNAKNNFNFAFFFVIAPPFCALLR
jgi:hypothetical protein